jgi:alkylation response protein AidB-like acyl-CoA dehydrogenase
MAMKSVDLDWVEKARALEPEVAKWRDVGEAQRRLPAELFQVFNSEGFFRLTLPRALGGTQIEVATLAEIIEEVARQDGAVGWNVMICSLGGCLADYLSDAAVQEMFTPGDVWVGSFAPTGEAVPVQGGYRAKGRWSFGSGCQNATWLSGGFLVMDEGKPRLNPDGSPHVQLLFFPRSQAQILDTWDTAGLRGTGSHDYQVEDVFIPADRGFPLGLFFAGPEPRPGRAYPHPFLPTVCAPVMAAVALGIAREAIDSFTALATSKIRRGGTTLAQQQTVHLKLGEAEALVRSARAYLYETARRVDSSTELSPDEAQELAAGVRLAGSHIVQCATKAVDLMFEAGGGSSIYKASPLERCFRDVHMVSHHVLVSPEGIEMAGQYLLGLGLQFRR